jgi:hypothetical protein
MSTSSIPITINGIRFRSLIEARWAEMFSKLGWDWEYEPIELNGYIPDFIIKFPNRHLLVEVKGETNMENIEQYADKIIKSGWDGEFLLVCSVLEYHCNTDILESTRRLIAKKYPEYDFTGNVLDLLDNYYFDLYIGLLGSTKFRYYFNDSYLGSNCDMPCLPLVKEKDFANLSICSCCNKYTIFNIAVGFFWCRYCGASDNLLKNHVYKNSIEDIKIKQFWNEAKNSSQWKPK